MSGKRSILEGGAWLALLTVLPYTQGCLDREEQAALDAFRAHREEISDLARGFIVAAVARDSVRMSGLAADSVVIIQLKERATAFRAAATTFRPARLELARCSGRLQFEYVENGSPRDGAAEFACRDDGWVITWFSMLVEY